MKGTGALAQLTFFGIVACGQPFGSHGVDPEQLFAAPVNSVWLAEGYQLASRVRNLNFPVDIAFGASGQFWIAEAGLEGPPAVQEITGDGQTVTLLTGSDFDEGRLEAPISAITYRDGWLYIVHRQIGPNRWLVGSVSRFRPDSPLETFGTLLTNLPSAGTYRGGDLEFGADGRLYVSIGTATHTAVVGPDNVHKDQWLIEHRWFQDFSPVELMLNGNEYVTDNPLTDDPNDTAVTPPFAPFDGGRVDAGQVVAAATVASPQRGMSAGNGAIYSLEPQAASPRDTLRLEAWGLRNPLGLASDPADPQSMLVTNCAVSTNGVVRDAETLEIAARPLAHDRDDVFELALGGAVNFFGWPDFFHHPQTRVALQADTALFCSDSGCPGLVLDHDFRAELFVPNAVAQMSEHGACGKLAISTTEAFGLPGDLFVPQAGAHSAHDYSTPTFGYRVVRVNPDTGEQNGVVINNSQTPDALLAPDGFNKPVAVAFHGGDMYVVDMGVFEPSLGRVEPSTGKVWVVSSTCADGLDECPEN